MASKPIPQLAPATALVQIIQEYSNLPRASWTIDGETLWGHVYGPQAGNFTALHAWEGALGASSTPRRAYISCGMRLRDYVLTTRWRDVPVTVHVSIPAGEHDPALLEGLLAEQRHQLCDPAVSADRWAVAA